MGEDQRVGSQIDLTSFTGKVIVRESIRPQRHISVVRVVACRFVLASKVPEPVAPGANLAESLEAPLTSQFGRLSEQAVFAVTLA